MIRGVVRADQLLDVVHFCDWPTPARCPRGVRVPEWASADVDPERLARNGRRFTVVRCSLDHGHGGGCEPPAEGRVWVSPRTLCGLPMPDGEFWVLFDPAIGDRRCGACDEAWEGALPVGDARALLAERFGSYLAPYDNRRPVE